MAPDDETLYLNLGRIYVTMDERERLARCSKQLLERKPGNALALKALAELEGTMIRLIRTVASPRGQRFLRTVCRKPAASSG